MNISDQCRDCSHRMTDYADCDGVYCHIYINKCHVKFITFITAQGDVTRYRFLDEANPKNDCKLFEECPFYINSQGEFQRRYYYTLFRGRKKYTKHFLQYKEDIE